MKCLLLLTALLSGTASAESPKGWGIGLHTGASILKTSGATWNAGPSLGIHANKSLPSGAFLRFLLRVVPMSMDNANAIWNQGAISSDSLDGVLIRTQMLMALRYAPEFQAPGAELSLGPLLEGAIGVDVAKTHVDLAGPEGIERISTIEPLPAFHVALGLHSVWRESFAVDASVAGQMLLSFDRGERGGGDDLRVLFLLSPGLEFSGKF